MATTIRTSLARRLGLKYPIMLAGMANVSNAELAAAVSNAGGLGVIGGAFMTPAKLSAMLSELKERLHDPSLPFAVDLLLPKASIQQHLPLATHASPSAP